MHSIYKEMMQTRKQRSHQNSDNSQYHSETEDEDESPKPKRQIMITRHSNDNILLSRSSSEETFQTKTLTRSTSKRSRLSSASTTDNEFADVDHSTAAVSDDFVTNWSTTTSDDEQEPEAGHFNEKKIQMIIAHRALPNTNPENPEFEFLVKYFGKSYKESQWVLKNEINNVMLKNYLKKNPTPQPLPYYNPEYDQIDYIVGKKEEYYLVKWKGLDYNNLTFETADTVNSIDDKLIPAFEKLNKRPEIGNVFLPPHPKPSEWEPLRSHKPSKRGLQLKPYQLQGLNFLIKSWYFGQNAILADEMGLGKTCQTCVFINYLQTVKKIKGPYLIVVPLSTITHWERELADWTENNEHRILLYCGIKERRKYQKMYEMFYPDSQIPKFNILVTTYQFVIKDAALFSGIKWRCVAIDEAHRLKNHESKLINCFRQFEIDFKLLLTGTPLQNNIEELWTLLNFLNPAAFDSLKDFESKFGELKESDQVIQLQAKLEPLMIRRRKGDVENSIVPLEEIIIECPMTNYQKAYYKSIFKRNLEYLSRGAHKDNTTNLINISMELRKVCNHPYLIKGAEDQILIELRDSIGGAVSDEYSFVNDSLIRSAGKMILLDKLLKKLKEDGHRVLIFSQMTKMLDILQDYLSYRNYKFERLDGNVRGDLRQASIDKFNEPNSQDFVFLLCTKAGGVGINLTSADTVIIYDSDWNPQNDIQATARCHRIGQTKEVKMYRFITAKSYERKMFETASHKLGLDQALLNQQNKKQRKEELDTLLKFGAYYAFEDEENEVEKFNENEDIDAVLSRSQKIKHENAGNNSKFSITQFELDESDTQIDVTAPDFWQKYLPDVKEDDLSLEGVSIGERRRILREGAENIEGEGNTATSEYAEAGDWNKKKLSKIMSNFMRFGWGRWKVIYENSEVNFQLTDIKEACIVLLGWMIKASEESFPVLESIYTHSRSKETKDFENIFKYYSDTKVSCSSGAAKKLSRLDLLYFLNGAVGTCPNPPDDIIVPDILNQKPTEWWTEKDDQLLLYGAWQYGYMNYSEIKFTNPVEQSSMSNLTVRLRNLITGLKNAYMKYKEKVGDANLPFNYETLKASQGDISKRDHKVIIHYLNYYGYPDVESFKKVANLMSKSDEILDDYVQTIINYCKKGDSEDEKKLADKISRPDKLLQEIELFDIIREKKDSNEIKMDDQELLEYVAQNGLIGLNSQEFITRRFGSDNVDTIVKKYLKKLLIHKINGPKSSSRGTSFTLHNYVIPDYEKNDDGTPKLPIKISQIMIIKNLGKVVYDRPNFHSERYIYPVGYEAERMFTSIEDPNDKAWYVEKILDGGDYPLFRVEMKDDDKNRVFEGPAPSKPWTDIVKYIENRKKKLKIGIKRCTTISGPEMFGLYSPLGSHLVQNLENADKCTRFMKRKFKNDKDSNTDDNNDSDNEEGDNESEKDDESNDEKTVTAKSSKSKKSRQRSSSKEKSNINDNSEEYSIAKLRPQRRTSVRTQEKLELICNFSEIADESPNDLEFLSVSVPVDEVLQRDRLDTPIPFSNNPLEAAVEYQAIQVGDIC